MSDGIIGKECQNCYHCVKHFPAGQIQSVLVCKHSPPTMWCDQFRDRTYGMNAFLTGDVVTPEKASQLAPTREEHAAPAPIPPASKLKI